MARTKATVRRMPNITMPKNIQFRQQQLPHFKIKKILPETRIVSVKKNGQKIGEINVKRKAIHFMDRNARSF